MAKRQVQRITEKKIESSKRGGEARKNDRGKRTEEIHKKAQSEITSISNNELFLLGVCLYCAEGSKEKEHKPGVGVEFTNSDPLMLSLFIKWLFQVGNVHD